MNIDLSKMSVGDIIEGAPLFGNMTSEPVVFMVSEHSDASVSMKASFFGVALGTVVAADDGKGGVKWTLR